MLFYYNEFSQFLFTISKKTKFLIPLTNHIICIIYLEMSLDRETLFILCFFSVEHQWSKKMQNTPILPSTSFLSTFHSDLDFVPNKEVSKFKTKVTDENIELYFEADCTRVTIKTQTTSLTLPKDLWRTLEAAGHHNLHLAEEKVNNSVLSLPTYFQAIERIRLEQGFHPLKDSKGILFP